MPIDLARDERRQWLIAAATGILTIEEILEFMQVARSSVDARMMPLLFDARGASTTATDADVDRAVAIVRNLNRHGPRGHVALVADTDRLFGLMLRYETGCAAIDVRIIRVFRQRADAERWLEIVSAARHLQ
ncbi:MAG TPA: hypothetical protein VG222_04850 [Vicinamibacterales bacterium]|nr:hypothetical protein [Vicinamibacterales bacterium]